MLLFASLALAAPLATAVLDAPVPDGMNLDLMPEPGSWPCSLTVAVDGMGAVTDVKVARGCPTGLVETAKALGRGWTFSSSAGPHDEPATARFHVLGPNDVAPKPVSAKPDDLTYLVRGWEVLPAPPTSEAEPTAPYRLDKAPKVKLPKNAAALQLGAGTCLVRVTVGTDGKVGDAKVARCLDVLAPVAVDAAKKLKFTVSGASEPATFDLPVRFAPAD